jgi:putative acetyltransferase
MITCIRTDSGNTDFQNLVQELDADLRIRDGEEHSFFAQFNKIDSIRNVVVAYHQGNPVGCGAIKHYTDDTMEVKRMYVHPEHRGRGIASVVLKELEDWVKELGYKKCILETGEKQPEAIALYHKNQYGVIPNFGQYADVPTSICFEKRLQG